MMESDHYKVNVGASLLETLTSALYADPIVVFREYVQNSVDSFLEINNAHRDLVVSITIDVAAHSITIDDNGAGIPETEFQTIMLSLGKSKKVNESEQIGFRGIGRLAGLAFCDQVEFLNKKFGQRFLLDGKQYRKLINSYDGRRQPLDNVMQKISKSDTAIAGDKDEGFRVELKGISDELLNMINGRSHNLRRIGNWDNEEVSAEFVAALRTLLPLPYPNDFDKRVVIENEYNRLLSKNLSDLEFKILLNGQQLYKNVPNIGERAFVTIPMKIRPNIDEDPVVIGLLWLSFDFVLRSVGCNFGVAVRSKNMLVQSGAVFAKEATDGRCAITTYGQYLAATKGITGELLLDTKLLSDNSRRDWFKLDGNAFQLREQICDVMNGVHRYRYAISKYVNSFDKNEVLKQKVFEAYRLLMKSGQDINDLTQINAFLASVEGVDKSRAIDEKSDVRDIKGYSKAQNVFYKKIMDYVYEYCDQEIGQLRLTDYYALKSYVVKRLNEE